MSDSLLHVDYRTSTTARPCAYNEKQYITTLIRDGYLHIHVHMRDLRRTEKIKQVSLSL